MSFPSPDDLAGAPAWGNYVAVQAALAALGLIPEHAHAFGVAVDGTTVELRFQLKPTATDADYSDIREIADELSDLLGDAVEVRSATAVLEHVNLWPERDTFWIYKARLADGG